MKYTQKYAINMVNLLKFIPTSTAVRHFEKYVNINESIP